MSADFEGYNTQGKDLVAHYFSMTLVYFCGQRYVLHMAELSKNEKDFFRIATWSSTLAFVVVGAILGSLTGTREHFGLEFSIGTIVGALIGGFLSWGIWKFVQHKAEEAEPDRQ